MTIANVPVRVRWEFFFGAVLLGADRLSEPLMLAWWIVAVGVFVGVHEMGHALMFRYFGHTPHVELIAFGGVTHGTPGRTSTPKEDFLVALAGPMTGLLIGGALWLYVRELGYPTDSRIVRTVIDDLVWINLGWSLLNLLPILPLDGGQVFSAVLRRFLGEARGLRIALIVSLAGAGIGGLYALSQGMIFATVFAAMFAMSAYRRLSQGTATDAPSRSPVELILRRQLSEQKFAEALATLQSAPDPRIFDPYVVGYTFVANDLLKDSVEYLQRAAAEGNEQAAQLLNRVLNDLAGAAAGAGQSDRGE